MTDHDSLHTVLGATGVIGKALASELDAHGCRVRRVSRATQAGGAAGDAVSADLLDPRATSAAIRGSQVAYLVAGLPYDTRVWQEQWPVVMRNVIEACVQHGVSLVFLDNVYAYGRATAAMTETTPFNPCSRKGEVRAAIATMMMEQVAGGSLTGAIVRSADFYGPGAGTSFTEAVVTQRLLAGKSPQWIGDPRAVHTFTFTTDVARSLGVVGTSPDAFGQVWHAATSTEPVTGETFVRYACDAAGRPYGLRAAPRWMLSAMSLFSSPMRENMEMLYQFEYDYRFDSSKLTRVLGVTATEYAAGLRQTLKRA